MEIKAPNIITPNGNINCFLCGSIDLGESFDWQQELVKEMKKRVLAVNLLNPRREFWNQGWKQEFNDPNFSQQVNWELDAMEKSDFIFVNILPDSKSPITLLELGLYAKSDKLIVCCPKAFYRSGNVHILCDKYYIPLFEHFDHAVEYLVKKINNKHELKDKFQG